MTAARHLPATLAGQPLAVCGVPSELTTLLSLHGKTRSDTIGTCWSEPGTVRVTLQNEFEDAVGYRFDWGWVIPAMPRWYVDDFGNAGPPAWRFIPIKVWQELARADHLVVPVHDLLGSASTPVHGCSYQFICAPAWLKAIDPSLAVEVHVGELERALPHDLCTIWPLHDESADPVELVRWIERALLPHAMPLLLRLLKSAALARIHEITQQHVSIPATGGSP